MAQLQSTVVTGNTSTTGFMSAGSRRLSIGILDLNSSGTPTQFKIKTTIPWNSGGADFTVNIKGFRYGGGQMVSLSVGWHHYNNTFYNEAAISNGGWAPVLTLAKSADNFVIIHLAGPNYWPKLYVESLYSSTYTDSYSSGWTWSDADLSDCTDISVVPYNLLATSISGNSVTATTWQTGRNITIGSTSKFVNGSADVSWSLAEIGAQAAGSYLALSGGTMTGDIVLGTASASTSNAFSTFVQVIFDNSHNDIARGPNKIVLHNNGTTWVGGFGVHGDTISYYSGGAHRWYKSTSQTAFTHYMTLSNAGNLGIGTETPQAQLQVGSNLGSGLNVYSFTGYKFGVENGTSRFIGPEVTGSSQSIVIADFLLGASAAWGAPTGLLTFTGRDRGNNVDSGVLGYIGIAKTTAANAVGSGDLVFGTAAAASLTSTERMRITNTGNVGVGTISPTVKFQIDTTGFSLRLRETSDGTSLVISGNQIQARTSADAGSPLYLNYSNGGNIYTGSGLVGIGTINPGAKLEVYNGDIWLNAASGAVNPEIRFIDDSGINVAGAKIRYGNGDGNLYIEHVYNEVTSGIFFRNQTAGTALNTLSLVNGKVGIGILNPTYKFEISDGTRTGVFNPNSTLDGFFIGTKQAKPLIFGTNDTQRVRIDANGNVGIGVTPNAWSGVSPSIQLGGSPYVASTAQYMYLAANVYYNGTSGIYVANGAATIYAQDAGKHVWYIAPTGTAGGAITFTQAMTLDASGRLIVNHTNTAKGNIDVAADNNAVPLVLRGRSSDGEGQLEFWNYAGSVRYGTLGSTSNYSYFGSIANTPLFFSTNSTERMRIFADGNVGIGTGATNAGYKLDVNGTMRVSGASTFSSTVTATGNITSSDGTSSVITQTQTNAPRIVLIDGRVGGRRFDLGSLQSGAGTFSITDNTAGLARFIIASDGAATFSSSVTAGGNVTIEKTTPGLILNGLGSGNSGAFINLQGWANTYSNWQIGVANIAGSVGLGFTPSTSAGGTTFTTPVFQLLNTGAATFSSSVTANGGFIAGSGSGGTGTPTQSVFQDTYGGRRSAIYVRNTADYATGRGSGYSIQNGNGVEKAWFQISANDATQTDYALLIGNSGGSLTIYSTGAATFSSSVTAATDMRAPIFYDSNNASYYADFASGEIKLYRSQHYSGGFSVSDNGGYLTYRITTNNHADGWQWQFTTQLPGDSSWIKSFWVTYDGSHAYAAGSFRAPVFYDSAAVEYYLDPNANGSDTGVALSIRGSVTWPQNQWAWATEAHTSIAPMSIKLWDQYGANGGAGNPVVYGTLLHIYGRSAHEEDQLIFDSGGSILHRNCFYGTNTWNAWRTMLDSVNYNSYSPTLTGGGASGTWGINVTGSSGSVSGLTLTSSANGINPDNVTQNQIGYNTSVALFGQIDGGLYSSAYSSSWIHQIYGDFRTGQIAIRGKNSGAWQPWRVVLDSSNVASYALTETNSTFTYSASLTLSTTWQDTGVSATNLSTSGVYIVTCYVSDFAVSGGQYFETYAGMMYWYAGSTNSTNYSEIQLHHSGHADNDRYIYLRTRTDISTSTAKIYLQIKGNGNNSGASTYSFTFKRLL